MKVSTYCLKQQGNLVMKTFAGGEEKINYVFLILSFKGLFLIIF